MRSAVRRINATWSRPTGKYFEVYGVEEVPRGAAAQSLGGNDAQTEINRYVAEHGYDVYIGLMEANVGTPTPRAASGTIEEYEIAAAQREADPSLRILFYFKRWHDGPIPDEIRQFRERVGGNLLYSEYDDTLELAQLVDRDLSHIMQSWDTRNVEAK